MACPKLHRFTFVFYFSILILFLSAAPVSFAALEKAPILRLNAAMHTASIYRIAADQAGRYLATASLDKTARVWDARTGELLKVLRPPIGVDAEGMLYAVGMSPDGELVACGGKIKAGGAKRNIFIFAWKTGRVAARISDLPGVVSSLEFSPDGRFLAAALGKGHGIRVYATENNSFAQVAEDTDFKAISLDVSFSEQGRLAAVGSDGFVRLYDAQFKRIAKQKAPGGKKPSSVSFSPGGDKLAVGFFDQPRVSVLSAADLTPLFQVNQPWLDNGNLFTIAWSANGRYLYAGGKYEQGDDNQLLIIPKAGRGAPRSAPAGDNTVISLAPLPGGSVAYATLAPEMGVYFPNGERLFALKPVTPDFRGNHEAFLASADGAAVGFWYKLRGGEDAWFSLAERNIHHSAPGPDLKPPVLTSPTMRVNNWRFRYNPSLNGTPLPVKKRQRIKSMAMHPGGDGIVLGSAWYIYRFGPDGQEYWRIPTQGGVNALNIPQNGEICLAAQGDGTIRWYRLSDGRELLALFAHKDQKRWILWTPSGYYDASAGGENLIGWHLNRGPEQAADFFPASRFRKQKHRPDIIDLVLETLDEQQAVRQADAVRNRRPDERPIRDALPPVVTIISPQDDASFSREDMTLTFTVRSPDDAPLKGVRVLIDGQVAHRGPAPKTKGLNTVTVRIPKRDVTVGLVADNTHGAGDPVLTRLLWKGSDAQQEPEFVIKPKLYILAVGVSDYEDDSLDLNYAAKDAVDFSTVAAGQKGLLYRDVVIKKLTDMEATRDNILDALEWIETQTTQHDVAALFFSGHGVNDKNGDYYFLSANAEVQRLRRSALPFMEIKKTVDSLPGKTLFFVDTCHAGDIMGGRKGAPDIDALVNELASAESGAVVFASSTGRQYSLENKAWGNGAFTKALVEALSGKAAYLSSKGDGRVTVNMLDLYVSERVKELTNGRQTPTTTKPRTVPDFPVAVVQ